MRALEGGCWGGGWSPCVLDMVLFITLPNLIYVAVYIHLYFVPEYQELCYVNEIISTNMLTPTPPPRWHIWHCPSHCLCSLLFICVFSRHWVIFRLLWKWLNPVKTVMRILWTDSIAASTANWSLWIPAPTSFRSVLTNHTCVCMKRKYCWIRWTTSPHN